MEPMHLLLRFGGYWVGLLEPLNKDNIMENEPIEFPTEEDRKAAIVEFHDAMRESEAPLKSVSPEELW
jgi:hypothetical protein